jgi:hypothetical protein
VCNPGRSEEPADQLNDRQAAQPNEPSPATPRHVRLHPGEREPHDARARLRGTNTGCPHANPLTAWVKKRRCHTSSLRRHQTTALVSMTEVDHHRFAATAGRTHVARRPVEPRGSRLPPKDKQQSPLGPATRHHSRVVGGLTGGAPVLARLASRQTSETVIGQSQATIMISSRSSPGARRMAAG